MYNSVVSWSIFVDVVIVSILLPSGGLYWSVISPAMDNKVVITYHQAEAALRSQVWLIK
jgi:hypothetical protein